MEVETQRHRDTETQRHRHADTHRHRETHRETNLGVVAGVA